MPVRFRRQINFGAENAVATAYTVVGVVQDMLYGDYVAGIDRIIYFPKNSLAFANKWLIAHDGDGADIVSAIRQLPQYADWEVSVVGTPESLFREQFLEERTVEMILSGAAAFALILAIIGIIYSLARALVDERAAIGIRFALGATPADVSRGYFATILNDLILVWAILCIVTLVAKFTTTSTFTAGLVLWLLAPTFAFLAAICAMISHILVRQLAGRTSIRTLCTT